MRVRILYPTDSLYFLTASPREPESICPHPNPGCIDVVVLNLSVLCCDLLFDLSGDPALDSCGPADCFVGLHVRRAGGLSLDCCVLLCLITATFWQARLRTTPSQCVLAYPAGVLLGIPLRIMYC